MFKLSLTPPQVKTGETSYLNCDVTWWSCSPSTLSEVENWARIISGVGTAMSLNPRSSPSSSLREKREIEIQGLYDKTPLAFLLGTVERDGHKLNWNLKYVNKRTWSTTAIWKPTLKNRHVYDYMCLVIWKMVSSAMTSWYNNNGLRTRVILDFVDQNIGWGTLHDILHEQQVLRTHTYAR